MDTSETNIKMCEKAEEIQEQRPQVLIGLMRHYYKGEYQYEVDSDGSFWRYKRHFIWLPRQDQLQEMVEYSSLWSLNHRFSSWLYDTETFEHTLGDWIDMHVRHCHQGFTSMEQLWLAFVQKENHNKLWDGEEWVQ